MVLRQKNSQLIISQIKNERTLRMQQDVLEELIVKETRI